MKRTAIILLSFVTISYTVAQDLHFSNPEAVNIWLNPALTGFNGDFYATTLAYKNQWSSVSSGINTFAATIETPPFSFLNSNAFSLGIAAINDVSGTLNFGTTVLNLTLNYIKLLNPNSQSYFAIGINLNTQSVGYNPDNAIFGRYPESSEGILVSSFRTYDFALGVHYQQMLNRKHKIYGGISAFHINEPNYSFFENEDIRLPMRLSIYAKDNMMVSNYNSIDFKIFMSQQGRYNETVIGASYNFNLNERISKGKILSAGLYYRVLDAILVQTVLTLPKMQAGITYDINLSKLTPASKTYGSVEIFIRYGFNIGIYQRPKSQIPCPVF
jgi:type IX secretion system PorP/SprF family membrane protein